MTPEQMQQPQAQPGPAAPTPRPMSQAFERVVLAAQKVLYTKPSSDAVIKMLRSGEPAQAIAQTTLFVMKVLFDESKEKIPPPVMVPSAKAVLFLLSELAGAAGVQVNEQVSQQAEGLVVQSLEKRFGGEQAAAQEAPPAEQPATPPTKPAGGIINAQMQGA